MNHPPQHLPAGNGQSHRSRDQRNSLSDFRHFDSKTLAHSPNGNGPVPVPRPNGMNGNGFAANATRNGGFGPSGWDISRSPPGKQNTSHVPCKFYLQGTCQAGKACPFSHEKTLSDVTPCKYFAKGNCKFGAKCALPHVLPDGRLANQPYFGMARGPGPFGGDGRGNMGQYPDQRPQPSMMEMQNPGAQSQGQSFPYNGQEDYFNGYPAPKQFGAIPTIDAAFTSPPGSNYGSPPSDGRMAMSSTQQALNVLDAPLPASFDSQGISHFARHGPMASSVPSRFGHDNPLASTSPSSMSSAISRAFGNLNDLASHDTNRNNNSRFNGLAASPPHYTSAETLPRRIMHSERQMRPQMISSSLPRPIPRSALSDDEDDNSGFEDDLDQVPSSLHDDVLTPQEKARRFSRNEDDGSGTSNRRSLSGFSSLDTKAPGSSPSRYGAFFASKTNNNRGNVDIDALAGSGSSPFGHVGSPLRNSSLNPDFNTSSSSHHSPSFGPVSRPRSGEVSPFLSSPPRPGGIGMISQALERTRLTSGTDSATSPSTSTSTGLPQRLPPATGTLSSVASPAGATRPLDRAISSTSIGRERIDGEPCVFSMEEEEEQKERHRLLQQGDGGGAGASAANVKRWSGGGWNIETSNSSGKSSPQPKIAVGGKGEAG